MFRGEITITGATGSAGASESNQERRLKKENFKSTVHLILQCFFSLLKKKQLQPAYGGLLVFQTGQVDLAGLDGPKVPQIPSKPSKQTSLNSLTRLGKFKQFFSFSKDVKCMHV